MKTIEDLIKSGRLVTMPAGHHPYTEQYVDDITDSTYGRNYDKSGGPTTIEDAAEALLKDMTRVKEGSLRVYGFSNRFKLLVKQKEFGNVYHDTKANKLVLEEEAIAIFCGEDYKPRELVVVPRDRLVDV
jgi:hypothetical protein